MLWKADLTSCPYLPRRPKLQRSFHQLLFLTVGGHHHTRFGQVLEYEVAMNLLPSQELLSIFSEGENCFRSL